MITSTFRFYIFPERRNDVLKTLRGVIGPTEVQPGCLHCRIYQDVDNPNALTYVEEWESEGALKKHVRSDLYEGVLSILDLSTEEPVVQFHAVSETRGLDLVEEVRLS